MQTDNLLKSAIVKYIINPNLLDEDVILSTDSRKTQGCNVFAAISGDNFDAFEFRETVCSSSIKIFIYEERVGRKEIVENLSLKFEHIVFIAVENVILYLQEVAMHWILQWKEAGGIVLGLTGSNGKTTTKEILFQFAKSIYKNDVICTEGNLNNHIGVPLTIFKIKSHHKFAIIEMGTNHPGEIEVLCNISNPEYGVITNVGAAHLEFLKDLDGVFKEKTALYRYIKKSGKKFYVNCTDEKLSVLENQDKTKSYYDYKSNLVNRFIREEYNIHNLNISYFLMQDIFPSKKTELEEAYENIKLPANKRSQWIEKGDTKIFLDAYNANPSSMKASIISFVNDEKVNISESLFICGDMNELGENVEQFHKEIGELLKSSGAKNVIFVGRYAKHYRSGYGNEATLFETKDELTKNFINLTNNSKFIFIKASRSLQLESLLDIN